jgi:hypothetical protein
MSEIKFNSDEEAQDFDKTIEQMTEDVFKVYDAGEVAEAEAVIESGFKIIESPKFGKVKITFPSLLLDSELKRFYSKKYIEYLREGELLTIKQLTELLEKQGTWTYEDDVDLENLRELYQSKTITIAEISIKDKKVKRDLDAIKSLMKERQEIEKKLMTKSIYRASMLENTVEKKAEEDLTKLKLVKCCINFTTEKPIWESVEQLDSCYAIPEFENFLVECLTFWGGVNVPLSDKSL